MATWTKYIDATELELDGDDLEWLEESGILEVRVDCHCDVTPGHDGLNLFGPPENAIPPEGPEFDDFQYEITDMPEDTPTGIMAAIRTWMQNYQDCDEFEEEALEAEPSGEPEQDDCDDDAD
jgi:hypothetical protein